MVLRYNKRSDIGSNQQIKSDGSNLSNGVDLFFGEAQLLLEQDEQARIEQSLRMSVGVHQWLIEQGIFQLGKGKVAIHGIPDVFTEPNSDDIG